MRPIPPKLRNEIAEDPFYKNCCLAYLGGCSGRVEWHHHLIVAGRQLNRKFAIVPLCSSHHGLVSNPYIKEKLTWLVLNRATQEELIDISRAINYVELRHRLNKVHGEI